MRSPKTDPQRSRVYAWENQLTSWAGAHATASQMRSMVDRCCKLYRVPTPPVRFVTKDKRNGRYLHSQYDPNTHDIVIRPRHMDLGSAIHESAHAIVDYILGPWGIAHGKEFLGVYLALLTKFKILPKSALLAHAKTHRLAYCKMGTVGPKQIRKRFKAKVRSASRERKMLRLWQRANA